MKIIVAGENRGYMLGNSVTRNNSTTLIRHVQGGKRLQAFQPLKKTTLISEQAARQMQAGMSAKFETQLRSSCYLAKQCSDSDLV